MTVLTVGMNDAKLCMQLAV